MLERGLLTVFDELVGGAGAEAGFVLNPADPGLLASLDRLTARAASHVPGSGGASIAAHVDHLRYGLSLLNRWHGGEDPFADADYSQSWTRLTVTEDEWAARRRALRDEAAAWREALATPREGLSAVEAAGMVASAAHLAYHLGAIRQIDRRLSGPRDEREP
jgi:hypothetical protein